MSDIVERLRQVAAAYKSLPTSGIWATMTVDRDASCNNLTDAADEIERLMAEVAGLREELEAARQVMRSVRVFVTGREKIKHPEGTEWFDSAVTAIDAALAARKGEA